jgi:multidrug efflux system outer membrane protein
MKLKTTRGLGCICQATRFFTVPGGQIRNPKAETRKKVEIRNPKSEIPLESSVCTLIFILLLALAGGCALGPNYKRPAVNAPENFRFALSQTTNSFADLPWWETFKDPVLQGLIRTALSNNYNLKQAVARVEQARNQVVVARSPLFPQINYAGDIGRGRNALFNQPNTLEGQTFSSAQVTLNAFWEIDFWGRIRRLSQAAQAQYLATDEGRRGVIITLVGDVATAYFQLLDLDQELQIQRAATNAYAITYRIFSDRKINGVASKLETDRAAAALADAAALIPQLELQIATTENRLNVLLGRNPDPIPRDSLASHPQPGPQIPAGLPSELLRRRPDVLASEQLLIAANADIGVSVADFFPRIGLTTFVGKVSPELSAFTAGSANAWNVGGNMMGPLFQGGRLRAQYRGAKAKFDEAKAAYQQSLLIAFREVSDALISRQKLAEARVYDEQAVVALTESVQLATQRYLTGKSSYFEVLQAQQELYPAQRAQVQALTGELISVVQLYRALGGGWQPEGQ